MGDAVGNYFEIHRLLPPRQSIKFMDFNRVKETPGANLSSFSKKTKAIFTSSIVWTCLVGFFYLKEHTHIVDFCMIPVTLCGVLFIAKPPFIFGGSDYTHRYGVD